MTSRKTSAGWVVDQFGNPRGIAGRLAGWIMANRSSNRRRNAWTVDVLGLQPGARVLEIGFGPGLALHHAAASVGATGQVVGVDRSEVMHRAASRRNHGAIAAGTMRLQVGDVESLPIFPLRFDAIYAINSVGFWAEPVARFQELRALLAPSGQLALTVQPRSKAATAATSAQAAERIECQLRDAGFQTVIIHTLALNPPAVCVIAYNTDG